MQSAQGLSTEQEQTNNIQSKIREQLLNDIEDGLEYILQTIELNERVMLPLIKYKKGMVYGGEWKNGMRDGKGRCEWPNGAVYVGDWEENALSGWGKLTHQDGEFYEGEWKNDKYNGKGTYFFSIGTFYKGNWKDDKQNGKSIECWANGQKYEGECKNQLKHGYGMQNQADGSIFEGYFEYDDINNFGTYPWLDRKYTGEWRKNKIHGKGTLVWTDGRKYIGEYVEDKKQGKGQFMWADGRQYIGPWVEGKQNGIGIFYKPNQDAKIGIWNMGRRKCWIEDDLFDQKMLQENPFQVIQILQQKLFDLNREIEDQIQIIFHDNQRIKLHPIKLLSGAVYEGEWSNVLKDGQGKILFPDGSFYEGQLKNNLKHGWGKKISKDGKAFEGQWFNDIPIQENEKLNNIRIQKKDEIDLV